MHAITQFFYNFAISSINGAPLLESIGNLLIYSCPLKIIDSVTTVVLGAVWLYENQRCGAQFLALTFMVSVVIKKRDIQIQCEFLRLSL